MGGAFLASKIRMKGPVLALLCIPPIIGCSMLMTIDHTTGSKGALLAGYYLVGSPRAMTCCYNPTHNSIQISVYPGISECLVNTFNFWQTCKDTVMTVHELMLILAAPLIYSWSAQNTAGDTKRKCTTAFLFIGQSAGNVRLLLSVVCRLNAYKEADYWSASVYSG